MPKFSFTRKEKLKKTLVYAHFFVSVLQPWFYLPARWLVRLFFLYLFIKKFRLFRNGHPQVFCKKVFLEISQISQKNTCTKSQNTSCNTKSFAIVMLVFFFALICLFVYLFIYLFVDLFKVDNKNRYNHVFC